jgi:DNA-binding transcriptional ArsR family regulator
MASRQAARGRRGEGREEVYRVKSLVQVRALANPLRMRILVTLAEKPRTTKQVADLLGQPATRLYHHVAALEKAGLVRLRKTRPLRGTVEKYYQAVASRFEVADNIFSGAGRPTRGGAVTALVDQAREGLLRALAKPIRGSLLPLAGNATGVVTPEQYEQLRRQLLDLMKGWEAGKQARPGSIPVSLTVVLFSDPQGKV